MEPDNLLVAAEQAKTEIDRQIDQFIEKIKSSASNPDDIMSMSQLEKEWKVLKLNTHKTYSDLVGVSLTSLDNKELSKAKKALSSRKESV